MAPIPSMTGGAGGASGAASASNSSGFNDSGWNVNFGAGTIDASGSPSWMKYAALAAGALVLWYLLKKRGR